MEEINKDCMQIGEKQICGARSFLIAVMIIASFCILAIKNNSIDQMTSAAMLVIGFFFGMRVSR